MAFFAMAVLVLPSKLGFRSEPGQGWYMTLIGKIWGVMFGFFLLAFNVVSLIALIVCYVIPPIAFTVAIVVSLIAVSTARTWTGGPELASNILSWWVNVGGKLVGTYVDWWIIIGGKVLFIFFTCWISFGAVLIFNQLKNITSFLEAIEEEVGQARDESVMLLRAGQVSIRSLNDRLFGEPEQGHDSIAELLKTIGPLALMFMKQEKNIFFWGLSLVKIAQKGLSVAKRLGDKH
jgi:hypothetical protein